MSFDQKLKDKKVVLLEFNITLEETPEPVFGNYVIMKKGESHDTASFNSNLFLLLKLEHESAQKTSEEIDKFLTTIRQQTNATRVGIVLQNNKSHLYVIDQASNSVKSPLPPKLLTLFYGPSPINAMDF